MEPYCPMNHCLKNRGNKTILSYFYALIGNDYKVAINQTLYLIVSEIFMPFFDMIQRPEPSVMSQRTENNYRKASLFIIINKLELVKKDLCFALWQHLGI